MDAKLENNEEELAKCQMQIANLDNDIYKDIKPIIENYKHGITTEKELLQVKVYYFKKKYLQRILAGLH